MSRPTRRRFLAALGTATVLGGCAGGSQVRDATVNLNPQSVASTPLAESSFSSEWKVQVPGEFTLSTPGIDVNRLYIGSGTVQTAISRDGDGVDWQRDLDGMTHSFSAAVTDDAIVASARDLLNRRRLVDRGGRPTLTALDPASGDTLWREALPVAGSPVVGGDMVYVTLVNEETTALSARSLAGGTERWRRTLETPDAFSTPAVGNHLYLATAGDEEGNARLVSLTTDGAVRWTRTLEGTPHKGPAVATDGDEVAYVGTDAGYLYAVGAGGDVRWQADLGGPVNTTPAVGSGTVYATTPGRVVAVSAATGTGRWSGRVEHVAKTGLSLGGGMVHVGGNEVAAFEATDGTPQWRVELPGVAGTFGSPLYVDGALYAGGCVKIDGSSRYDHTVWALV